MPGTFVLRCSSAPFLHFAVTTRRSIVGRSSLCHFVVNHRTISRRHAEVCVCASDLSVSDLDSMNGTFVDNQRVQTSRVLRGQVLRFGSVPFVVTVEELNDLELDSKAETDQGKNESPTVSATTAPAIELLTEAQQRVFDLLISGQREKCIALRLNLSWHTVHNHVRNMRAR